jgi:hypothetical protein
VKDYNDLCLKLSKMDSSKFHNDVDILWKNIKEGRKNIEGSCSDCPKKNPLELFFG